MINFLSPQKVVYTSDSGRKITTKTLRTIDESDTSVVMSELEREVSYLSNNKMNNAVIIGFNDGTCKVLDGDKLEERFSYESKQDVEEARED